MGEVKLLDCTLRDGGYLNDWEFGHDNLVSIFERLVEAGIDIVEIGFLDERRPFDINRSIMPDTDSVEKIYGKLNRKNSMVIGMIDYGTCSLDNIKPCSESFLDGIRVIFKKSLREPALEYCKELKKKGYKVFAQLVSVTSYDDAELKDLIRLANEVEPFAVSIVDTYGLLHQSNLMHYFNLLNEGLKTSIALGYHGHNNFQMGYSNCITMLSNSADRDIFVDGSLHGMGKSAGNAPIELVAMHMNQFFGKKYGISQILEAIDSNILPMYQPASWGYNMFFFIAALNDCHPNYVKYLTEKRTLSVKSINEILSKLEGENKLLFDKDYIERLYAEYQKNEINDDDAYNEIKSILKEKNIIVIGPGKTTHSQRDRIDSYIAEKHPVIISINYVPEGINPDFIFLSNSKRYVQLATRFSHEKYRVIATSNITSTGEEAFSYVLNFSTLMDADAEFIDNSLVMLIKALIKAEVKKVVLAGFDGYSKYEDNYHRTEMEYDFVKSKAEYLNNYTSRFLGEVKDSIEVIFLTDSRYSIKYE